MNNFQVFICLLILVTCVTAKGNKCIAMISDNFDNCTTKETKFEKYHHDNKFCENLNENDICINEEICRKTFTLSYVSEQLFGDTMKETIITLLENCCGGCARCILKNELESILHLGSHLSTNASDIIFPVLADPMFDQLYGYHFIPVFEVPSAYYFTLRKSEADIIKELIWVCLNMWPLFTVSLLLAMISGFIAWSMETLGDTNGFSKVFIAGLFEGFWWSFVSMTTVGYGDKAIRSYQGRIYAIVWILIGLIVCAIFTGSLTSEVINVRSPSNPKMVGKIIGSLKHRLHEATIISQHRGILQEIDTNDTILGIVDLMNKLYRKEIDGFLIDRPTHYYFKEHIDARKYRHIVPTIPEGQMRRTERSFEGNSLEVGILMKNVTEFNYFKKYFEYNRFQIQVCNALKLNFKSSDIEYRYMALDGGLFGSFLKYCLSVLAVIVCFGIAYDIRLYYVKRKQEEDIREEQNLVNEYEMINIT